MGPKCCIVWMAILTPKWCKTKKKILPKDIRCKLLFGSVKAHRHITIHKKKKRFSKKEKEKKNPCLYTALPIWNCVPMPTKLDFTFNCTS